MLIGHETDTYDWVAFDADLRDITANGTTPDAPLWLAVFEAQWAGDEYGYCVALAELCDFQGDHERAELYRDEAYALMRGEQAPRSGGGGGWGGAF